MPNVLTQTASHHPALEVRSRCLALGVPVWVFDDACKPVCASSDDTSTASLIDAVLPASLLGKLVESSGSTQTQCFREYVPTSLLNSDGDDGHAELTLLVCRVATPHATWLSWTVVALVVDDVARNGIPAIDAACSTGTLVAQTEQSIGVLMKMLDWSAGDCARIASDKILLDRFSTELMSSFEHVDLLFQFARLLNCDETPHEIIRVLTHRMQALLPFDWISVGFSSIDSVLPELAGTHIIAGHPSCDREELLKALAASIENCRGDSWTSVLDVGEHPLSDLVQSQIVAEPISHDGKAIGMLIAGGKAGPDSDAHSQELQFLDATSAFLGVFHASATRYHEQRIAFYGMVKSMTAAIDAKDNYTRGHSERVAHLSRQLATAAGISEQDVERIYIAGLLHDIGKIGVPERVLCKSGRLTDAEFELIKLHPETGANILKDIPALEPMLAGVLHHHERWDGRGYPHKLAGEAIPFFGRVLAVADAFDAMSSTRSYRPALPRETVLSEMFKCAGTQFDPRLAMLFLELDLTEFDAMLGEHSANAPEFVYVDECGDDTPN